MSVVEGLKIQIHVCGIYVLSVWFIYSIDWVRQRLDIFSLPILFDISVCHRITYKTLFFFFF